MINFNLNDTTILVRFTRRGEMLYLNLNPELQMSETGYYELNMDQVFSLYRIVLMGDPNAKMSDIVNDEVLIKKEVTKEPVKKH